MTSSNEILVSLVTFVSSCFMIFGGAIPYLPQYLQIQKERSAEGFSLKVCLVLITANILRIAFWFGKFYETPLLIQSILMILVMIGMLELCLRIKSQSNMQPSTMRRFLDMDMSCFWLWDSFLDYLQCIGAMIGVVGVITYMCIGNSVFVETIGTLSLMTESTLALPQFIKNYNSHSTKGMSVKMVLLWFLGDSFKTLYFLTRESPLQFLLCGTTQTLIDMLILYQVVFYDNIKD